MMDSPKHAIEAMDIVQRYNLPFKIINDTEGDGNCYYRMISDQIQYNEGIMSTVSDDVKQIGHSHLALRHAIVNYCETNVELSQNENFQISKQIYIEENKLKNESHKAAWQRLLQLMRKDGTYAEDIFIEASAIFLKKDIKYLTDNNNDPMGRWSTISGGDHVSSPPLTMVYLSRRHFQSIHAVNEQNVCKGCGKHFNRIASHLVPGNNCSKFYNLKALKERAKFQKIESKRKYREKNLLSIQDKHREYNAKNKASVLPTGMEDIATYRKIPKPVCNTTAPMAYLA